MIYAVSIIGIFFLGQRIILDKTIPMDRLRIYQYMCYFAILGVTHIFSRESIKQYRAEFSIKNFIKNIITGILIFVILFFVFIFVSGFSVFSMKIHMGIPQFLYMLFFQICIVGATEEISFRGFLLREISAATTGNLGIFFVIGTICCSPYKIRSSYCNFINHIRIYPCRLEKGCKDIFNLTGDSSRTRECTLNNYQ